MKEVYYYLDNVSDHSYMSALYRYPQSAFPYKKLIRKNRERKATEPEFELIDTGLLLLFKQNWTNSWFNIKKYK